jgi:signal transduction histidine kinase
VAGPALRRLWVIGVVLPAAFIIGLELIRAFIDHDSLHSWGHVGIAALMTVSVIAFATAMIRLIERTQREVVRQNHELRAVTSASAATRGEVGLDEIIDAALKSVIESSGAIEASVTVFAREDDPVDEGERTRRVYATRPAEPEAETAPQHVLDVSLSTPSSRVGHLQLWFPTDTKATSPLAPSTLQSIGHQLASSIQIGQLVAALRRRQREGLGLYELLLQVSNREPLEATLTAMVRHARDLLAADEALIWLEDDVARAVRPDASLAGAAALSDGSVRTFPSTDALYSSREGRRLVSSHSVGEFGEGVAVAIRSPAGALGGLSVQRRSELTFTRRDRRHVSILCDLASIAITSAQMSENERQGAIIAERERIAREMHDGLAQVLGVIHLRLRALDSRPEVQAEDAVAAELVDLAELAEDAYRDVREAILGLRESSRTDRKLLDSLRAYLDKYSRQCGIATSLEATFGNDLEVPPQNELQVIRVIQEALTNARKHSGARSAVVRVLESDLTATFIVEDDGRGFDLNGEATGGDGFGLQAMRERMELIGGTLLIDSAPGRGTRVIAECPRHPRPAPAPTR